MYGGAPPRRTTRPRSRSMRRSVDAGGSSSRGAACTAWMPPRAYGNLLLGSGAGPRSSETRTGSSSPSRARRCLTFLPRWGPSRTIAPSGMRRPGRRTEHGVDRCGWPRRGGGVGRKYLGTKRRPMHRRAGLGPRAPDRAPAAGSAALVLVIILGWGRPRSGTGNWGVAERVVGGAGCTAPIRDRVTVQAGTKGTTLDRSSLTDLEMPPHRTPSQRPPRRSCMPRSVGVVVPFPQAPPTGRWSLRRPSTGIRRSPSAEFPGPGGIADKMAPSGSLALVRRGRLRSLGRPLRTPRSRDALARWRSAEGGFRGDPGIRSAFVGRSHATPPAARPGPRGSGQRSRPGKSSAGNSSSTWG